MYRSRDTPGGQEISFPFTVTPDDAETTHTRGRGTIRIRPPLGERLRIGIDGTCLGSGLIKSLHVIQGAESIHKAVIISGDGRPTQCPFVPGGRVEPQLIQRILDETATVNAGIDARIHTIFVGTDGDTDGIGLMRSLSRSHNGTFQRVVSAESATSGDRSEEGTPEGARPDRRCPNGD